MGWSTRLHGGRLISAVGTRSDDVVRGLGAKCIQNVRVLKQAAAARVHRSTMFEPVDAEQACIAEIQSAKSRNPDLLNSWP